MSGSAPFDVYVRIAKCAGLNDAPALIDALRSLGGGSPEVSATLRYHHLAATLLATIDDAGRRGDVEARLLRAIESARPNQPSADVLLTHFDEMRHALQAAGIDTVLLKGVSFAERLYGGYHRRPQFDLDVLIRARHRRAARRELERLGYTRETYDLHSETYTRGDAKADVHGWLRRAPAYRIDEIAVWKGVHLERIGTVDVPTLDDEFALLLLAVSLFEDVGQGMVKLKQLVDAFLLLRQVDASTDWDAFFAHRSREHTDGIAANVFALVAALFDGEADLTQLCRALAARRHLLGVTTRELAIALVSAPRKHPANLSWFGQRYPGTFWLYLVWFWYAGFPANLPQLQSGRVLSTLRAARRR